MSQGFYCSVRSCHNNKTRNGDLAFFSLPKNPEEAKIWLEFAGRQDLILVEDFWKKNYRICSAHFSPSQLKCTYPRKLLYSNSYPWLKPPKITSQKKTVKSPVLLKLELPESGLLCCTQCSYQVVWRFQLDHHIQRNHRDVNTNKLFHAAVEPELYPCSCCSFISHCKLGLYEHCNNQHNPTKNINANTEIDKFYEETLEYPCDRCNFKGHSSLYLIQHNSSCKTISNFEADATSFESIVLKPQYSIKSTRLQCCYCLYKTTFKSHLRQHMLRHVEAEEIPWIACSYRTKEKGNLIKHLMTHAKANQIIWYSCTKCLHRTREKGNLKKHMLMVHAETAELHWFNCAKCSYRAKTKGNLKRHMLTHAAAGDIEWFNCTECSYRSKRNGGLKRHMLIHTATQKNNQLNC